MNQISWQQRESWQNCPSDRIVMYQTWQNLAFLHWKVPFDWLSAQLPAGLHLDTYQGEAWLGIVPFEMRNIRPAKLPTVPYISDFLELNVRTYVYDDRGRPGVWFFSLSANRLLAVWAARTFFHLPYFWSKMKEEVSADSIFYQCQRFEQAQPVKPFTFHYSPHGKSQPATKESLEFFLTERYLMFVQNNRSRKISCGQVHHSPYETSPLDVIRCDSSIINLDSDSESPLCDCFQSNPAPDHSLFCHRVNVKIFGLRD